MIAILTLLCVLYLSLLVMRLASIALSYTGLSRESARFQARSAFTGVGFTTNESETVVNHPVRRRILMFLMLGGNAGIVTAMSSTILAFLEFQATTTHRAIMFGSLVTGMLILWLLASSKWLDRRMSLLMGIALKRYTSLDVRDYESLLRLTGEYRVAELFVEPEDWLGGRTLQEAALRAEGINVLGVKRKSGEYLGDPSGDTLLMPEDTLIVYGRTTGLEALDRRRKGWEGDREHDQAVVTSPRPKL